MVWNEVDAGWFSILETLYGVGLWAPVRNSSDNTVVIDAAGVDNMGFQVLTDRKDQQQTAESWQQVLLVESGRQLPWVKSGAVCHTGHRVSEATRAEMSGKTINSRPTFSSCSELVPPQEAGKSLGSR